MTAMGFGLRFRAQVRSHIESRAGFCGSGHDREEGSGFAFAPGCAPTLEAGQGFVGAGMTAKHNRLP